MFKQHLVQIGRIDGPAEYLSHILVSISFFWKSIRYTNICVSRLPAEAFHLPPDIRRTGLCHCRWPDVGSHEFLTRGLLSKSAGVSVGGGQCRQSGRCHLDSVHPTIVVIFMSLGNSRVFNLSNNFFFFFFFFCVTLESKVE